MPKVTAPLFSLSASGSIGKTITYRATRSGAAAQHHSRPTGPASPAQVAERARLAAAASAWRILAPTIRAKWAALAAARLTTAWLEFSREYLLQQSTPAAPPLIPAVPFGAP